MSTWIFLRGLTREARHWGEFPEIFRGELPDADIVALDLAGNGSLHRTRSPASIQSLAALCRAEARERGVSPPYHLLAMSLGGMVAVAWSRAHPEEVGACILINSSMRPFSTFRQRLRPDNYRTILRLALLPGDSRKTEEAIMRLTSNRSELPRSILDAWIEYRLDHPVSRANAVRQLLAAARYRAPAEKPAPPILILASALDKLVDPECSRQLALRWTTAIAVHPGAGHDLPLDDGRWVARQVRYWLADGTTLAARTDLAA